MWAISLCVRLMPFQLPRTTLCVFGRSVPLLPIRGSDPPDHGADERTHKTCDPQTYGYQVGAVMEEVRTSPQYEPSQSQPKDTGNRQRGRATKRQAPSRLAAKIRCGLLDQGFSNRLPPLSLATCMFGGSSLLPASSIMVRDQRRPRLLNRPFKGEPQLRVIARGTGYSRSMDDPREFAHVFIRERPDLLDDLRKP